MQHILKGIFAKLVPLYVRHSCLIGPGGSSGNYDILMWVWIMNAGKRPRLLESLRPLRHGLVGLGLLSGFINLLLLGFALYVMVMFDTVMPGRNLATLVGLSLMLFVVVALYGGFAIFRMRFLTEIASAVHRHMANRMPAAIHFIAMNGGGSGDGLQPLDDVEDLRAFLSGPGAAALLDLPWVVFAAAFLCVAHFWLGALALLAILAMAALCLIMERGAERPVEWLAEGRSYRRLISDEHRSRAETIHILGMAERFGFRWNRIERGIFAVQLQQEKLSGTLELTAISLRLFFFAATLALGIWLAFDDRATVGVIMGAAILLYLALAPMDRALANWSGFCAARRAWNRLDQLLPVLIRQDISTILPPPTQSLEVAQLAIAQPGTTYPIVQGIGFRLKGGESLGIIGASGAGKTVLLRGLTGVWHPVHGTVRLDGAALQQWSSDLLGPHIGYLPQGVELLNGTVAQNIARFDPDATSEEVIAAASAAGVHSLILHLPEGYETKIGRDGLLLPPGQRQRIGLARALFRDPFLVLLDDPSSNLDSDGDAALTQALRGVRARKGIAIIAASRHDILDDVDYIMVMKNGTMGAFGPRDRVIQRLLTTGPVTVSLGNDVGEDVLDPS